MIGHSRIISLGSPIKGVVRTFGRESQPDETCWNALNIVPYDRWGRLRVSQRTGTVKQWPSRIGSGNFVQGMGVANFITYPGQNISGVVVGPNPMIGPGTGSTGGPITSTNSTGTVLLVTSTGPGTWVSGNPSVYTNPATLSFTISQSNMAALYGVSSTNPASTRTFAEITISPGGTLYFSADHFLGNLVMDIGTSLGYSNLGNTSAVNVSTWNVVVNMATTGGSQPTLTINGVTQVTAGVWFVSTLGTVSATLSAISTGSTFLS